MTEATEQFPYGVGYMDGEYCAKEGMQVPGADLGFLLSDTTYDALHVINGKFFRMEDHLDRWEQSITKRQFHSIPYDRDETREILMECVRRSGLRKSMVYLLATRGEALDGLKDLRQCQNRFLAWAVPYYSVIPDEKMEDGIDVCVSSVMRTPPDAIDPTVKKFDRIDFSDAL